MAIQFDLSHCGRSVPTSTTAGLVFVARESVSRLDPFKKKKSQGSMADQSLTPYPLQSGGVQSQRRAARRRGDRRGSTQGLLDPHQDHLHLPLPHRPHLLACQGRLCDTTTVSKDLGPRGIRGGGEHRGTRRGVRGGRYGGADVPGSVRHLLQLRVRGEQHVLLGAVPFAVSPGMRRDGTTRFRDAQGEPLHDFLAVSSFSQYTVVDVNQAVKVHPAVPPKLACLLSCGAGTGVGAAWRLAKVEPGSSVVIFGLGAVGLAVAQGAKMCGATKIVGVDLNPAKQELGKMFGLTDFVNPSELGESSVIEDDRRRSRLLLRVHRCRVGDDRCLQKR
ncbi:hypothetical protein ACQ4PT_035612 [Festuca glaucescens]